MDYINTFISDELIYALGWTMIHSLWQSILIALVLAFLMLGLQQRSAKVRCLAANISLFSVLLLALFTFIDLYETASHSALQEITLLVNASNIVPGNEESSFFQTFSQQFVHYFNEHLPLLVTAWLLGMAFFLLRFLGGLAYVQHLKHHRNYPLPAHWQIRLDELAKSISLKLPLRILESNLVKAPIAIGYFKPIILLPIGAINHLSVEQVEAILAHEIAHIHRKDYLLNLIQSLIEVIFYYNPAVWWISANIRTERENCCDDLAIEICGNSLTYAKALVSLQEIGGVNPRLAMSFSKNKNQLLNRVKRILNQPQNKSNIMEKFTATCMLLVALLIFSISANPSEKDQKGAKRLSIIEKVSTDTNTEAFFEVVPKIIETIDTLPKGKTRLKVDKDGEKVEAKIKDGKITYLKIDEKEIPKENLEDYEDYVEELINDIPEPLMPISPPPPPPPIHPITPVVPSSPKAPSAPSPGIYFKGSKKIETKKDEDGNAFIFIESPRGNEIVELKLEKDGAIFLNKEKLNLNEDETTIILEDEWPIILNNPSFRWVGENDEERLEDFKEYLQDHGLDLPEGEDQFFLNQKFNFDLKGLGDNLIRLQKHHLDHYEDALVEVQDSLHQQQKHLHRYQEDLQESQQKALEQLKSLNRLYNLDGLKKLKDRNYSYGYFNKGGLVNDKVQAALEAEMINSGLVEDISSYQLSISGKSLKINGKLQSDNVHQRFKDIYESVSGFELGNKSKIVISKDGED